MALQGLVRCLVLVLSLGLGSPVLAQNATVVSIGDGDTVRVRFRGGVRTVRLACIDAPEMAQSPWGRQTRQQLQALAPIGSAVELRSTATDRYGRLVAEVLRGKRNVNQALVSSGAAFVYWQYIAGCDRQTYSRLETQVRLQRLGVWSIPGAITKPWDFRLLQRPGAQSGAPPAAGADRAVAVWQQRLEQRKEGL